MTVVEKLWEPLGLFALLIAVVAVTGDTTTASSVVTTNVLVTNTTAYVDDTSGTTVTVALVTLPDNKSSPMNSTTSSDNLLTTTSEINYLPLDQRNASTLTFEATTSPPSLVSPVDSGATSSPLPLGPDDSNTNTKPDPVGRLTTIIMTSSPTPNAENTTPQTAKPSVNGETNPYDNIPNARLQALTPQQQRQLFNQWFFMTRNYPPFYLWQSRQQTIQPGSTSNMAANNFAPLYMTAMDMELWPLLFAQQRSQQLQRQVFPNPNIAPIRHDQRIPQQVQNRNNLANTWFFLNEL